jgi:DnaJ-class molecular chaperone
MRSSGNPETRKKYDELGANWRMYEQAQARGGPDPFAQARAGHGGGFRTMSEEEMEELFGDSHPFFRLLHHVLRRQASSGPRAGRRARAGRDVEHEIELSLEDAYRGVTRRLRLQHDGQIKPVDVRIPPGVGDGSRVRVAGEGETGFGRRAGR